MTTDAGQLYFRTIFVLADMKRDTSAVTQSWHKELERTSFHFLYNDTLMYGLVQDKQVTIIFREFPAESFPSGNSEIHFMGMDLACQNIWQESIWNFSFNFIFTISFWLKLYLSLLTHHTHLLNSP